MAAPPIDDSAGQADVLRSVTFYMGLMLALLKFGMLQELQSYLMNFKGYLLYVFGIPAIVGVIMAGGVRRSLVARPGYYWTAFAFWLWVCVPLSSWRGSSFRLAMTFSETDLPMLFVIAGLVISWKECKTLTRVIGAAAALNILTARIFAHGDLEGRLNLEFGTVANANDFAAHLLLTLPFLLLFLYTSKSIVLRAITFLMLGFGVVTIFRTASRGALLALVVLALFVLLRGTASQRLAVACLIPMMVLLASLFVSGSLLQRIRSFSEDNPDSVVEAMESSHLRKELAMKAIEYAITHPLVGVGPGQFAVYEGTHNIVIGTHGFYRPAHNSFLTAAVETGFPGGILFLAGFISSFLLLNRTYNEARRRPYCRDIQNTAFCAILSMIGYSVAITFLNFTYYFAGPAIAGIAISLWRAARTEFARRDAIQVAATSA